MSYMTPPSLYDPYRWRNLKIGLFGGTFNPPHAGHIHVCEQALKTLSLDAIWWMVTPQNPLKRKSDIAPFTQRINLSREIVKNPRIVVTDIEKQLITHKSIDTIHSLKNHYPFTQFIWIAGSDNALSLHKWENWQDIIQETGFLFISRPPAIDLIKGCPVRLLPSPTNKFIQKGLKTFHSGQNLWAMHTPQIKQSSTDIRTKNNQKD